MTRPKYIKWPSLPKLLRQVVKLMLHIGWTPAELHRTRISLLTDEEFPVSFSFRRSLHSARGCRMSKRRILKLFEENGCGKSGLAYALPGQLHSRSGCLLPWTIQQPPSTGTLVRGAGEIDWWTSTRSVRPSNPPERAPRSTGHHRLLVNKWVHGDAGAWAPRS
jgi:hypothetical protein